MIYKKAKIGNYTETRLIFAAFLNIIQNYNIF
jgi:hypothetical protein